MVKGEGGEVLAQSHIPDCLVLRKKKRRRRKRMGGLGIEKMTPPFKCLLTLKSLILCGNWWKKQNGKKKQKQGSAVRGQAYKTSRKSRTWEVGTDYKSVPPLWDHSQKLLHRLPLSLIWGREQDLGSEKEQIQEVIHKLRTSYSFVSAEHEVRYLYFHACLLLISLAFAVLDCCTWPQPPVGEK